jgi:hypothetical protein
MMAMFHRVRFLINWPLPSSGLFLCCLSHREIPSLVELAIDLGEGLGPKLLGDECDIDELAGEIDITRLEGGLRPAQTLDQVLVPAAQEVSPERGG